MFRLANLVESKALKNFLGYGPKTFRATQGRGKCFGLLVGKVWGHAPQKMWKISVLRLAENAFPTF